MLLLLLNLLLRIVYTAKESDENKPKINIFERYAGNLIYSENDGQCIACNEICDKDHSVLPHSWIAKLGKNSTFENCKHYALSVAEFGVVAFTWWKSDRNCSLHVLDEEEDISKEMINFNGYHWVEINKNNIGPLILARYPVIYNETAIDALCYSGLEINPSRYIVPQLNVLMFIGVVGTMLAFYGWMRYTDNFPDYEILAHAKKESSRQSGTTNRQSRSADRQSRSQPSLIMMWSKKDE